MKRPAAAVLKRPSTISIQSKRQKRDVPEKLPISILCGFLGVGKTTLLKHILEGKRADDDTFRTAVIVNDLAELNIDKSLIDRSSLIQSDDVIAMQNGCVCCTLQHDFVTQILGLAKQRIFDYLVIEASGVSEPAEIAKLFADCKEDPDHVTEHNTEDTLHNFARLDTCVTIVDSADFFNNLESIKQSPGKSSVSRLLMEQVEYANVVILNKIDLVNKTQLSKVSENISILNPRARILTAHNSNIDISHVVNSGLYKAEEFASFHHIVLVKEEDVKYCCMEAVARGQLPCCRSARTNQTANSKVVLGYDGPKKDSAGALKQKRHSARFGINSFIYEARRPFHPDRFQNDFIAKFFIYDDSDSDDDDHNDPRRPIGNRLNKAWQKTMDAQKEAALRKKQKEAQAKKVSRTETMGNFLRSKGFLWLANRHDMVGILSHANNIMSLDFPDRWEALNPKAWEGSEEEKKVIRKDWVEPWADRRQSLVFIGTDLKYNAIQKILDDCLLTDEEFAMGPDGWKALFGDILWDAACNNDDDDE